MIYDPAMPPDETNYVFEMAERDGTLREWVEKQRPAGEGNPDPNYWVAVFQSIVYKPVDPRHLGHIYAAMSGSEEHAIAGITERALWRRIVGQSEISEHDKDMFRCTAELVERVELQYDPDLLLDEELREESVEIVMGAVLDTRNPSTVLGVLKSLPMMHRAISLKSKFLQFEDVIWNEPDVPLERWPMKDLAELAILSQEAIPGDPTYAARLMDAYVPDGFVFGPLRSPRNEFTSAIAVPLAEEQAADELSEAHVLVAAGWMNIRHVDLQHAVQVFIENLSPEDIARIAEASGNETFESIVARAREQAWQTSMTSLRRFTTGVADQNRY